VLSCVCRRGATHGVRRTSARRPATLVASRNAAAAAEHKVSSVGFNILQGALPGVHSPVLENSALHCKWLTTIAAAVGNLFQLAGGNLVE
jgi:hypothetical protein